MNLSNKWLRNNGMHLSWLVALIAMLGSLYFSEIMHFAPCKLCWYQRILMYPLVVILGIAAVRRDYKITIYVLPLAIWGGCISLYHILLQMGVFKETGTGCGPIACDTDYLNWLGFITIPMLAGTAFLLITILQFLTYRATK